MLENYTKKAYFKEKLPKKKDVKDFWIFFILYVQRCL